MTSNPIIIMPPPIPVTIKSYREGWDSKKTPPNAILRNPFTNETVPCLVRDIFTFGKNGKSNYVSLKRINLGNWTDMFGLPETRKPIILHRGHPMTLEMTAYDEKTPDYFNEHKFLTLRFVSWRHQNQTQRTIHAAIVTPLVFSELVELWRGKLYEKETKE